MVSMETHRVCIEKASPLLMHDGVSRGCGKRLMNGVCVTEETEKRRPKSTKEYLGVRFRPLSEWNKSPMPTCRRRESLD
jgi:hypothetical protein